MGEFNEKKLGINNKEDTIIEVIKNLETGYTREMKRNKRTNKIEEVTVKNEKGKMVAYKNVAWIEEMLKGKKREDTIRKFLEIEVGDVKRVD